MAVTSLLGEIISVIMAIISSAENCNCILAGTLRWIESDAGPEIDTWRPLGAFSS